MASIDDGNKIATGTADDVGLGQDRSDARPRPNASIRNYHKRSFEFEVMILTFRVREYTRPVEGMEEYWVYCSGDFYNYYQALIFAIAYEKNTGIKTWVEMI